MTRDSGTQWCQSVKSLDGEVSKHGGGLVLIQEGQDRLRELQEGTPAKSRNRAWTCP